MDDRPMKKKPSRRRPLKQVKKPKEGGPPHVKYSCVNGMCSADEFGEYKTLAECEQNCGIGRKRKKSKKK